MLVEGHVELSMMACYSDHAYNRFCLARGPRNMGKGDGNSGSHVERRHKNSGVRMLSLEGKEPSGIFCWEKISNCVDCASLFTTVGTSNCLRTGTMNP